MRYSSWRRIEPVLARQQQRQEVPIHRIIAKRDLVVVVVVAAVDVDAESQLPVALGARRTGARRRRLLAFLTVGEAPNLEHPHVRILVPRETRSLPLGRGEVERVVVVVVMQRPKQPKASSTVLEREEVGKNVPVHHYKEL